MKYADWTCATPQENLACDEALLDLCETGGENEVLRFWESEKTFVVLGYSNRAGTEARLGRCSEREVPVLRRVSGGGTVLQGPGCLNYTLILRIAERPGAHNLLRTNSFVMERNRDALSLLTGEDIRVRGITDLALGDRKFSGNAQRRRRDCLLFHGTVLIDFDSALVDELLPHPSRQPEYRGARGHRDFLTNLPASRTAVKEALKEAWGAASPLEGRPHQTVERLARERYSNPEWNLRF